MSEFPRPLLLGHRGAAGEAPENTWPAFEKARAAGVHGFEVDVLLTRDGVPVCVHDLSIAPDGSAFVRADLEQVSWGDSSWKVGLYVITPEAVAAAVGIEFRYAMDQAKIAPGIVARAGARQA